MAAGGIGIGIGGSTSPAWVNAWDDAPLMDLAANLTDLATKLMDEDETRGRPWEIVPSCAHGELQVLVDSAVGPVLPGTAPGQFGMHDASVRAVVNFLHMHMLHGCMRTAAMCVGLLAQLLAYACVIYCFV